MFYSLSGMNQLTTIVSDKVRGGCYLFHQILVPGNTVSMRHEQGLIWSDQSQTRILSLARNITL